MTYPPNIQRLIESIIEIALEEDGEDKTSTALFSASDVLEARLIAKSEGLIAGLDIASKVFHKVDPSITFEPSVQDGFPVKDGQVLANVGGAARGILKAERVALNFLQRMSGIATATREYVDKVDGTGAIILDTRKTVPGHRVLDRMAVRIGGGKNHRMGLYDMALIKDNHIDNIGSITGAVSRLRRVYPDLPIEVEARSLSDVEELVRLGVDRIMLDNFTLNDIRSAVAMVAGKIPIEASGNITLDNVREVALCGVDYISVGAITHSVRVLDISMLVEVGT
ncbi:MAG: carboxylating nicotinate-nucleotide diphosphorylase [Deltaproteobacteria bacterium]|nr:carboxylating nicotinate-nucleotide diphosphorylase [Deltaproteobacteria bacterium]